MPSPACPPCFLFPLLSLARLLPFLLLSLLAQTSPFFLFPADRPVLFLFCLAQQPGFFFPFLLFFFLSFLPLGRPISSPFSLPCTSLDSLSFFPSHLISSCARHMTSSSPPFGLLLLRSLMPKIPVNRATKQSSPTAPLPAVTPSLSSPFIKPLCPSSRPFFFFFLLPLRLSQTQKFEPGTEPLVPVLLPRHCTVRSSTFIAHPLLLFFLNCSRPKSGCLLYEQGSALLISFTITALLFPSIFHYHSSH